MTGAPLIPARFNLARHCLERGAQATPDKTALMVVHDVDGEPERWSYGELDQAVRAAAGGLLQSGLRQGDRLLLRLPNNSDYALMFFGAIAAGLAPIPLSAQLTEAEVAFLLSDSEAAAIAVSEELTIPVAPDDVKSPHPPRGACPRAGQRPDPGARHPPRRGEGVAPSLTPSSPSMGEVARRAGGGDEVEGDSVPVDLRKTIVFGPSAIEELKRSAPLAGYADTAAEDPAYMIYTSGTTSRPKGVVHAHRVVFGRAPMQREWQAIGADDLMLHAGAFNWSYTIGVGMLDPWSVGATAVLYTGPKDVSVWPKLIGLTGATLFAAVPSLYRQMLKYCALSTVDLSTLRHGLAAGEALSPALLAEWQTRTGKPLFEALGMSECSTFLSSGPDVPVRPGSPGRAQTGRRIAVLPVDGGDEPLPAGEVGLLAVHRSDPGLMLGYWNRPDEDARTTHGKWFVGGDLAAFDADGYLWYRGRADDVMNAGGYRVSPLEVEAALADCPGIAEVAVKEYRVRDDVSVIAAYVVARDRAAIDADMVLAHAGRKLAAYKRPKQVFFVDSLPRSANGKLLRREL